MRKIIAILTLALTLLLASCAGTKLPDISEYGDTAITISGLTDEEFTITPNDLAKLKLDTSSATGKTEKAGTVGGVGPTLITFLEKYGKTSADFQYIRFFASDDYRITLRGDKHTDDVVLFAIAKSDKPLPESERPMRLIIPEAESNQWIYAVVRIEFVPVAGNGVDE